MGLWSATLEGERMDLDALVSHFQSPNLLVTRQVNDVYVLTSAEFLDEMSSDEVLALASELVDLANGALRLDALRLEQKYFPVSVSSVIRLKPDGTRHHALRPITVTLQSSHRAPRDEPAESLTSTDSLRAAESIVNVGRSHPPVTEVLRELSSLAPDFPLLSRVLETIVQDVGGRPAIVRHGWASKPVLELFTHTANTTGGRHARGRFEPPEKPMPIAQARILIKQIVIAWLRDDYGV